MNTHIYIYIMYTSSSTLSNPLVWHTCEIYIYICMCVPNCHDAFKSYVWWCNGKLPHRRCILTCKRRFYVCACRICARTRTLMAMIRTRDEAFIALRTRGIRCRRATSFIWHLSCRNGTARSEHRRRDIFSSKMATETRCCQRDRECERRVWIHARVSHTHTLTHTLSLSLIRVRLWNTNSLLHVIEWERNKPLLEVFYHAHHQSVRGAKSIFETAYFWPSTIIPHVNHSIWSQLTTIISPSISLSSSGNLVSRSFFIVSGRLH